MKRTNKKQQKQSSKSQSEYQLPKGKALIMRTCDANLRSHGGFQWPESGKVCAPDWSPEPQCGHGLHGLMWGEGDGSLLSFDDGAKWIIAEIDDGAQINLGGKVKFASCNVVFVGDRHSAPDFISRHGASGKAIVSGTATAGYSGTATAGYSGTATAGNGGTATAGDSGTATAGYRGTATAGDSGTATAGYSGTATAGYRGTATAGNGGTATAGDSGTATAGNGGTATAGDSGTATAGYRGTATAGDSGTATAGVSGAATAGYRGTATAGNGGTATAGDSGTAKSGDVGIIVVRWWDESKERYRLAVGYVGEDGIEPNTFYRCDGLGRLVKA